VGQGREVKRKRQGSVGKRFRGLDGRVRGILVELSRAYAAGRSDLAWAHWVAADRLAPGHPELERWAALPHLAGGSPTEAEVSLRRALDARPDDGELLRLLGEALAAQRRYIETASVMVQAFSCTRDAAGFLELGKVCDRLGLHQQALEAAEACLALSPGSSRAGLLRARSLVVLGRSSEAATECRRLIAGRSKVSARAWFLLLDMKTESIGTDELRQLEYEQKRAQDPDDRVLLAFALGQAYELAGEYALALRTLARRQPTCGRHPDLESGRVPRPVSRSGRCLPRGCQKQRHHAGRGGGLSDRHAAFGPAILTTVRSEGVETPLLCGVPAQVSCAAD
jgi:tetratricopeptide (TPR) repeat protein